MKLLSGFVPAAAALGILLCSAAAPARQTVTAKTTLSKAPARNATAPNGAAAAGTVWALLVSVDTYDNAPNCALTYPSHDARLLRETLLLPSVIGASADHVVSLNNDAPDATGLPTRANIFRELKKIIASTKPADKIWFYFGGHGREKGGISYLIPRDVKIEDEVASAVSVSDIRNMLKGVCPEGECILVLDACHSGSPRDFEAVVAHKQNDDAFKIDRMITFSACDMKELAWEFADPPGGVFTHFLVRGLCGEADSNKDGDVSSQELYLYLTQRVRQMVFAKQNVNQTPQMLCKTDLNLILSRRDDTAVHDDDPSNLHPIAKFKPLLMMAFNGTNGVADETTVGALEAKLGNTLRKRFLLPSRENVKAYLAAGDDIESRKRAAINAGKRGANYFLTGTVQCKTTRNPAIDPDARKAEITIVAELYDAEGEQIVTPTLTATGAGFSEQQAIDNALKLAYSKMMERLQTYLEQLAPLPAEKHQATRSDLKAH